MSLFNFSPSKFEMYAVCCVVALILSFVNFAFILYMWNSGPQDPVSDVLAISITMLEIVLGVLAVMLAVGAFAGFWMIKGSAVEAAREEARTRIDDIAPKLLEEARRLASENRGSVASQTGSPKLNIDDEQVVELINQSKRVEDDNQ
jgi:hypothetical protein